MAYLGQVGLAAVRGGKGNAHLQEQRISQRAFAVFQHRHGIAQLVKYQPVEACQAFDVIQPQGIERQAGQHLGAALQALWQLAGGQRLQRGA